MRKLEREFLALEKGTITVAKYNSLFSEKLQVWEKLPSYQGKQVEHYAEGLIAEYQANVGHHNIYFGGCHGRGYSD